MRKKFYFFISVILIAGIIKAQCETRIYIELAQKVFNRHLKSSDFSNETLFITIDTAGFNNIDAILYAEQKNPEDIILMFYKTMDSIKIESTFFNYYELINCGIYPSPLHQSFLVNNFEVTFKIDIWNNKDDITKIDGLTIQKYTVKYPPTPY